jgi:PAS domain S-box-containing protein
MSESKITPEQKQTIPWKLALIFLLFSAAIILLGIYYYRSQRARIFAEQENNLSAIAFLKINQIVSWHNERLGDAKVIKNDEPLIRSISHFFGNKNQEIKTELDDWMKSIINEYDYSNVLIADTSLKVRLSVITSDSILGDSIKKEMKITLKVENVMMTDLHQSKEIPYIHLDILVPLFNSVNKKRVAVGVAILRIDPAKVLFPLIQSWPTQSKSSETLLLRKEGDSILYLNELRHLKNTALNLKLPVSEDSLLASKAVKGNEGIVEGVDYRNVPVVGYAAGIPGLPWFMVAKVDKEEILSPLKRYVFLILIVIVLLILINASIFGFWIWTQQINLYRKQVANDVKLFQADNDLRKSEELFRELFENMLNGFAYCKMLYEEGLPPDFLYVNVNDAFESLTGLKDVKGKKVSEVIPGIQEADPELLERYSRVALTGKPEVFETYVDSLKMWFAISVYSPQKEYFVAVFDVITERKLAEEALRSSEERYWNVFNSLIEGFCIIEMVFDTKNRPVDYRFLEVNSSFEKQTGLHNAKGKLMRELAPDHEAYWFEIYGKVALTGESVRFENEAKALNRWYEVRASRVEDQENRKVALYFNDITERKLGETALRDSEERFRSLYENVTIGIYRTTIDGRILMANPAMVSMLGFDSFEQLAQRNLQQEGYEPDYPRSKFLETIEKDGKIIGLESAWNQRNGKTLFVRESANAVRDIQGKILYYDGTVEDITDRIKTEEALHENEKRLREAQEMAHLGFWFWDIKTGNVDWSDEVFKIFCLDPATFKPQIDSILELSPWPEDNQRGKELISRAIETHNPGTYEQKFLRPDKSIGYYYSTFRGSYDDNDDLVSIVGTILDITERKQAEELLRESEDKFKYVFDHSLIAKSITLPSGEINVNRAFCEMLGYQPEELKRVNWEDISHPDDIELTNDSLNLILSGKKDSVRFTKRYIHKNGSVIWADIGTSLRRDYENNPQYFMTSVNDITERKAAEEALRESEERFSKSFRTSPISFIIANIEDGRIIEINDAFITISGFTREEAIGNTTLNMKIWVHEKDRKNMIDSLREGNAILHQETLLRAKDGNISTVLLSAQVIKLANRNCIISSIEDITKRKEAEDELRIQSEIMSHMAEAVYLVRMEDGIIVYTNSKFEELFGYGPGDMTGKHVSIVNAPTEKSPEQTAIEIMSQLDKKGFWTGEVLNIKKDGTVFWNHANVAIFNHSKYGKVLVSVQEDITDRKNAEFQIKKLNEELEVRVIQRTELLEAANKELEAFSYSVSHDLRAPLRSVHGFTKILLEDYEPILDDEGKRICKIISSSATQMGELIDDLLSFSRIGRTSMNPSILNMKSMVLTVFEEICSHDQKSRINLKLGKLHKVFGDANLLRIVWNNLISNAIKYSSKEKISEIEIKSQLKSDRIAYSIKDNGVGFDMNYKHKLFGVFQRLHSEAEFEGNGVGLAIVQRIISKHGGKVWAEGEVGKGATFYFSLPVQDKRQKTKVKR